MLDENESNFGEQEIGRCITAMWRFTVCFSYKSSNENINDYLSPSSYSPDLVPYDFGLVKRPTF